MRVDVWPVDRPAYERNLDAVRRRLGTVVFGAAWREGQRASFDAIVDDARHEAALAASTANGAGSNAVLTPRQHEVLHLLCEGRSDREIGAALKIGRRTVETHIATIYGKLGVHSRAEAATSAVRQGLV
jgi:DNA-binding NarL/FixJ family response regulator